MERLLIVDGSNLLFQMFFGMPARIVNEQGKAIQGTLGFVGALLKILRMTQATHVLVVFDGEHENPRSALDENYKANRVDYSALPEEDSPFSQLEDIYAALRYLSVCFLETEQCEADDLIAGYAYALGEEIEVVISSFDSDFFQLIGRRVSVLRYRGDKSVWCGEDYLAQRFGITSEQYADFKSLTGDPADNIRGAEKIGPKTAAALLREFGSLDQILARSGEIAKPSVRDSVQRNALRLQNNYRMIKLGPREELPIPLSQLHYEDRGLTTTQVLRDIGLK